MSKLCHREGSSLPFKLESISHAQQRHGMQGRVNIVSQTGDLTASHGAVANKMIRILCVHFLYGWPRNLHRFAVSLLLDGLGPIVT